MEKRRIVTTCTRDCPSCCGLVAEVEDGRLTAIKGNPDHPLNQGGCCAKMKRYVDRVNSQERLLHPMRRIGSNWEIIGWEEALDEWASRIKTVIAESGPESILHYQGYGERTALKLLNGRFWAHLGGVTSLRGTLCSGTAYAAMAQDFGERLSHDPLDHLNSRTVILWGRNPAATQYNLARILGQARKNGCDVWLVDPAATESAGLCGRHIQSRPGADRHLALGAARAVLENGWEDRKFLAARANNFEAFRELAFSETIEGHAALAGVDPRDVRDLAQAMARAKPAAILLGWGMHRYADAHLSVRAIDALSALTGNIGLPGGGVSQGFEEYGPYDQSVWGESMHPPRRTLLMPDIAREISEAADPPVRLMVVSAANPACMAPDSEAVAQAISSREFVVYLGHFLDDTARLAHLVLPCATFLEEDDLVAAYGHHYLGPVNKAVEPAGQCRSQFDIYQDLAARFDFVGDFVKPLDYWLSHIAKPFLDKGFTLEQLRCGPIRDPDAVAVPWSSGSFATPSGRFEFLASLTPGANQTGSPEGEALRPPETCSSTFPLTLLTTGSPVHLCSELTLSEHDPLPEARVHPDAAVPLGLSDGGEAWLISPLARVMVRLVFDPRQRPDVCLCRRGGWMAAGHGLNRLIPAGASNLGNGTPYYRARVALAPVDSGGAGN